MSRQDSSSSGHASMLISMYGGASLESMKVCDDNRETVQRFASSPFKNETEELD